MTDPTIEEATLRMLTDGLSIDEIMLAFNGTVERSEIERIQNAARALKKQQARNAETLERMEREIGFSAWRIK